MKFKIAGGCGEHGRNCFYVEAGTTTFLVDCGVMAGEVGGGYPHLSEEEIKNVNYIFLTHSHADHSAAIPWMVKNGFEGTVVATKHTLGQLPFEVNKKLSLESFCKEKQGKLEQLEITYGYSGHCLGSVWYEFKSEGKTILFSGDYTEDTFIHKTEKIRNRYADLAIVDSAYGYDETSFETYCEKLVQEVARYKENYPMILMTVPKYGRGLELYQLLKENLPKLRFAGDTHFLKQCAEVTDENPWFKKELDVQEIQLYEKNIDADIVFVSDPQLKSASAQKIATQVLENGYAIMTGTVEVGNMSHQLIQEGKMSLLRFPVHLNHVQYKKIVEQNQFKQTIAYHSPKIKPEESYKIGVEI